MRGLGGFFPPLLLGVFRDSLGAIWPGFVLLALTSFALARVNACVFLPAQEAAEVVLSPQLARVAERLRAGGWATMVAGWLVAAILVGSRNLQHLDAALVIYTFAVVFASWGVAYHYAVWLRLPGEVMTDAIDRRKEPLRSGAANGGV